MTKKDRALVAMGIKRGLTSLSFSTGEQCEAHTESVKMAAWCVANAIGGNRMDFMKECGFTLNGAELCSMPKIIPDIYL